MIIWKKSRMDFFLDGFLKEKFSETNKFCNFPFTSRTMNMPEVILAGGDPLMPDTQGSHEVLKHGGRQHTRTNVLTAVVCTGRLRSSQCLVCKLLHVSWQLYCRDWFSGMTENASLPCVLISNSGSDGPYPSITGGDTAAGVQPCCGRL